MTPSNANGKHLTIAFDTWPLGSRFRNTGIHVYAKNLLRHFREMARDNSVEFRPLICRGIGNDGNQFEAAANFRPYQTNLLRIGRVWRYGGACVSARTSKADLLFCPSGNMPVSALVPVVATIHDVIPVFFPKVPKARGMRFEFANTARSARVVITDSLHSRKDLVEIFKLSPPKVHVVYLACNETVFNDAPDGPMVRDGLLKKLGLDRPYILHHGRIQERKNLRRLIEAYRLVRSRNANLEFDLVLVGELGWQHEEVTVAASSVEAPARVIFTGPQDDPELAMLLRGASMAVVPSLYEGFCLPLLEAMACGTPTICSNSSCLPEISGSVLRYFDPLSIEEMADCMERVLESSTVRQSLSLRGKKRASEFSWRRCAEETLAVLKSTAAN